MRFVSIDFRVAGVLLCLSWLAGCATETPLRGGQVVVKKDVTVQETKSVNMGRVKAVREVTMMDKKQPYARSVGGKVVADGLTQTMVGMLSPRQEGIELVVNLDNGESLTVVQAADVAFRPGDRVRVLQGHDGALRVTY
ncbi:MAG: hypothetical protein PHF20_08745 [Halothiobacillaceae bacterium]|nr:hypothetical protein [Halothiobacillaceae bacterium]